MIDEGRKMYPKKRYQEKTRDSFNFIRINQDFINSVLISKDNDFVDLKTNQIADIHSVTIEKLDKAIKKVDKIIKIIASNDENYFKMIHYMEKLIDFYNIKISGNQVNKQT